MKKVTFMFGLPASGKSFWVKANKEITGLVISADSIKESNKEYNPNNPEILHQWSVEQAEARLINALEYNYQDIYFDGGGINNSYNLRLLKHCEKYNYSTKLVVLDTPAQVCLNRNGLRNRKVPEKAIVEKAVKFNKCLDSLSKVVDEIEYVKYFTDKNIFVDMDGTIAAYQQLPLDEFGCIDFISGEYFKYTKPVTQIIDKLLTMEYDGSKLNVLSAIPDNLCLEDKQEWLDEHFPIDRKNRYFIGNKKYKAVMLRNILKKEKIETQDVTMIDDDHTVLLDLQKIGINAIHTSQFLANY